MKTSYKIEQPKIVGHIIHEPTKTVVAVYKPIGRFKRFMIRLCFGLKYKSCDDRSSKL